MRSTSILESAVILPIPLQASHPVDDASHAQHLWTRPSELFCGRPVERSPETLQQALWQSHAKAVDVGKSNVTWNLKCLKASQFCCFVTSFHESPKRGRIEALTNQQCSLGSEFESSLS
jgi:hypothetical protein